MRADIDTHVSFNPIIYLIVTSAKTDPTRDTTQKNTLVLQMLNLK